VGELTDIFGRSPALLTDLYQLTMAYGYWKSGRQDVRAAFHVFFRRNPFGGGYTVACGLEGLIEFIEQFRYSDDDLDFLARQTADGGRPLFEPDFLTYLRELRRHGRLPSRAAGAGDRAGAALPVARDAAIEPDRLSHAGRHQGRADLPGGARQARHRVWPAAGPGS
jgi:hypothetical protein